MSEKVLPLYIQWLGISVLERVDSGGQLVNYFFFKISAYNVGFTSTSV